MRYRRRRGPVEGGSPPPAVLEASQRREPPGPRDDGAVAPRAFAPDEPLDDGWSESGPLTAVARRPLPAGAILLAAVAVSVAAAVIPSRPHRASATVALSDPRGTAAFGQTESTPEQQRRFTLQRADFLRSSPVRDAAARTLGGGATGRSLAGHVTVKAQPDDASITVTARAGAAARAVATVNAMVAGYRRLTLAQTRGNAALVNASIDRRLRAANADLARLVRRGANARSVNYTEAVLSVSNLVRQQIQVSIARAQYGDGVAFVDNSHNDGKTASLLSRLARNGVLGVAVGVLAALGVCWLLAARRPEVLEPEELARLTQLPVLSEIGEVRGETESLTSPARMPTPAYERAATLLRSRVSRGSIALVSPCRSDGRSTTAAQLAAAAARDGQTVALVDADARTHGVSRLLGIEDLTPGTEHQVALDDDASITVVPEWTQALLADLRARFAHVFLDTPAATAAPESLATAAASDAIVLLVRAGTSARVVARLRDELALLGPPVIGAVLTRSRGTLGEGRAYGEAGEAASPAAPASSLVT